MEEKNLIDEVSSIEDRNDENIHNSEQKKISQNQPRNKYKEKECKVINYNKRNNTLDINFDGYGIRIKNATNIDGDIVTVKYKGEIGKPNFEYRI